jgi:hypothetical protein
MFALRSKLIVCLALLAGEGMVLAQAVTPPVAEFRGLKAEGSFQIDNSTDTAMAVELAVKTFKVADDGKVVYSPLESNVRVDIGASSFVIPPHDSHSVYYKAKASTSPSSFSIVPTMTPMNRVDGVRVNFRIPHMIYLYQKPKLAKSDVQVTLLDRHVRIVNTSEKLGRVQFIHVGSDDLSGFPIYPGQTREIEVAGDKVTVHFDGFKVELR